MTVVIFDLDGTLIDSDVALVQAFVDLGVPADEVTFGHVLVDECARLGISFEEYLAIYDTEVAPPYPGVEDMLARLDRWAVCSNKVGEKGTAELARLGWAPEVALFTEDFGGPKQLVPVLQRLAVAAHSALFVGDTAHDRQCAAAAGVRFALAAWNPRAEPEAADLVLHEPTDLLAHL